MKVLSALSLATAVGLAPAAWAQSSRSVEVPLGKTRSVDVGFAKGLNCDDTSVADISIQTKSAETNSLVVRGKKLGSTLCKVGNAQAGPTVTVSITVVKPPPPKDDEDEPKKDADKDE